MYTAEIADTLVTLFSELVEGAPASGGYVLNPGDEGLLRSLDGISAAAASALTATGSSIASHVEHVRFSLTLMNRWGAGEENPFSGADGRDSWTKTTVSDDEWEERRAQLRAEAARWLTVLRVPRDVSAVELSAVVGSIAHVAYHLGAIRQMNQRLRGPVEGSAG